MLFSDRVEVAFGFNRYNRVFRRQALSCQALRLCLVINGRAVGAATVTKLTLNIFIINCCINMPYQFFKGNNFRVVNNLCCLSMIPPFAGFISRVCSCTACETTNNFAYAIKLFCVGFSAPKTPPPSR